MRQVIAILLGVLALCAVAVALRVRVVVTSDPATNPYANMAVQGCQQMATRDSSVVCTTTIHTESTDATVLMADWNQTMLTATDDVFFGISPFMGSVLEQLAPRFPTKVFSAIDAVVDKPGANINGLIFAEDHAGYLAGALAGVFTQNKKVGVVAGIPLPALKRFVNGYHSGVLSVCPTCEVYPTYLPSFGDAVMGRGAADALIAKGIDVLFGAAGFTGSSAILHAAGRGIWVIGVDADESLTTFRGRGEIDFLLSSALKRVDVAVRSTIESIMAGKKGGYNVVLDSALNGLSLASFNSTSNRDFSTGVSVSMKGSDSCETTTFSSRSNVLNLVQSSLQRKLVLTNVVTTSGDKQPLAAPANKTWYDVVAFGERSKVQANMQGHATAHVGKNQLLTFGGQTAFGEFPNDIMLLDFDPYVWTKVALATSTAPAGRMFHSMAFDEPSNKIFVYGGQTAGAGVSSEHWAYDVAARSWTQLSPTVAPGARTNMAFAATGRVMYVYGGIDAAGALLGDMWVLDMSSSAWSKLSWTVSGSASPPPLQHATLVAVNATMLALYGGTLQGGAYSATLYKYDILTSTWSTHKAQGDSRLPPAERMRAVAVDKRRVLFTGGLTAQGLSNTTWVWKLDENIFDLSAYGSLPAGLHSHSLVTFNQSAHAGACVWDPIPIFTLCTKQAVTAVVAISGVTNRPGGGVLVSWANPDPLPPPVGKLDIGLRLAMVSFNAIGLVTAFALILFTIKHRKMPVVKAANPNLSIISLIGAAMAHLGIMTSSSIDEGRTAMMLAAFLLAGGYTLIFAAIMVKNGLIYFIFASKTRFKVRPAQLLFICAFALGLQFLLVALWFSYDTNPIVTLTISGIKWTINAYNQSWLILCAMPVVLLNVLSVFVSYKIRHVRSEFNETQYVAIAAYLIAMALLVIAPVMLLLDSPLVQYIITTVLATMTTMAVQGLFFANKVSAVYVRAFTPDSQVGTISLTPSGHQPATTSGVTTSNVSEASSTSTASGGTAEDGGLWCKYCKQQIRVGNRHSSSHSKGSPRRMSEAGGKGGKIGAARGSSSLAPTSVPGR